ncbi:GntR family transcriptional regulator [Peptoniphilaceae bacterium SGI.131]
MAWKLDNTRSLYLQLAFEIEKRIIKGIYKAGDKLPAVRDLAQEAGVNPNTMQRAFIELENKGLVFTNRTSGRFVKEDEVMIKKLKKEAAKDAVNEFFEKMKELDFSREEMIELINENYKGDGNGSNI